MTNHYVPYYKSQLCAIPADSITFQALLRLLQAFTALSGALLYRVLVHLVGVPWKLPVTSGRFREVPHPS